MWAKRLMKVFSDGSAMRREWRVTGSLRDSMWERAGSRLVGRPRKRRSDTVKKSGLERGKQGEGFKLGMYGDGL